MQLIDVIIIGKGPSGISAALYTKRANLETLIIGSEGSSLIKAEKIENYFGLEKAVSGAKLLEIGEKQAKELDIEMITEEVVGISKSYEENFFTVSTLNGVYFSRAILIATGKPQKKVDIKGLSDFEGKGVSYCTTCDGFFYRNLSVGVLGYNAYAIHEAKELEAFTKDITLFTNGAELEMTRDAADIAGKFKTNTRPIASLVGEEFIKEIHFTDGHIQKIDGLFVAYGTASSIDFANKLGIETKDGVVVVNDKHMTSIEGVFAAGDCTGGFKQVSVAVGQGAIAAKSMIEFVRALKK